MNSFIKILMEEKNLKQKELASILGISSAAISQWNEEGTNINVDYLFHLSKLFHVSVDELLEGRRTGESLEDKWKREYDINEDAARTGLMDGKKEKVLKYFDGLRKANVKFFELFEKQVTERISNNELRELEYLKQFYDDVDEIVINQLIQKIGSDHKEAITWELQKIYKIVNYGVGITTDREIIPIDDYYYNFGDDPLEYLKEDEDIFLAVYSILSPIEKDKFLTSEFQNKRGVEYLYELIKRGGKILYTSNDLNIRNYNCEDLNGLESKMKPVLVLDKAQDVIHKINDNYLLATYEDYQALINTPRMQQIAMEAKYKEKNPIQYWKEYLKINDLFV